MPGVDDHEPLAVVLLDVQHAREQRARAGHQRAPGLQEDGQPELAQRGHHRGREGGDVGTGAFLVVDAQAAADVDGAQREAVGHQLPRQRDQGRHRLPQRLQRADLRADVALHADDLEAAEATRALQDARRGRDVDAELVVAQARRDVRMRAGVDVRVDAQADRGALAARRRPAPAMRAISSSLSALNSPMPASRAATISASDLPTPAKTIRSGGKPARRAAFSSRPDTMSAPAPSEASRAQDGPDAVGLDGVADAMGHGREGGLVGARRPRTIASRL